MTVATFSEFRNNAKKYFDQVENGETVQIYRHGKPSATLIPAQKKGFRWKTSNPLVIKNVSASKIIIDGRDE
jgi:prevent-host-death family protein